MLSMKSAQVFQPEAVLFLNTLTKICTDFSSVDTFSLDCQWLRSECPQGMNK